jgi:hypothetical protein
MLASRIINCANWNLHGSLREAPFPRSKDAHKMTQNIRTWSPASKVATAVAIALAAAAAHAQSTTGRIVGDVPNAAGKSIVIENTSGLRREVDVSDSGRFEIANLPLGTYKVTVVSGGSVVDTRENVSLVVGAATTVSFTEEVLDTALVSASSSRGIDVSTTDTRTVITAEDLATLPLERSAEAIAFLAPGVVVNSGGYNNGPLGANLASFGGSAASENAYYLNGFNTTNPQNNLGGLTLPYGAIDQQEIFTGGYGAQYGRSNGGVINQVGKHGTNDWKFGGALLWQPDVLSAHAPNAYFRNGSLYDPMAHTASTQTTYSGYVGGPILEDHLFFYVAAEYVATNGHRVANVRDTTAPYTDFNYGQKRVYGKLDYRITDDHLLELTTVRDKATTDGVIYNYDYTKFIRTSVRGVEQHDSFGPEVYTGKYTGNFGDHLTLTALYGKEYYPDKLVPIGYDPNTPIVTANTTTNRQNPAYVGNTARISSQTVTSITDPDREYQKDNLRLALNWRIGTHSITAGMDNEKRKGIDIGSILSGPGYSWTYGFTTDPFGTAPGANGLVTQSANINGGVGAPSPGLVDPAVAVGACPTGVTAAQCGYYVIQNINTSLFSYNAKQEALFLEDQWNVTDKLLVSLGVRSDSFTNYTPFGDAYIDLKDQIAPRLGFSWDVNGDASFKVYGNLGRYYLGLPLSPVGLFTPATSTGTYFTYSGVNADGTPVISKQMGAATSANSRFGFLTQDIRTAVAKDIKGENQDELILGFSKSLEFLGQRWITGVRGTYRRLNEGIDDINIDTQNVGLVTAAKAAGLPTKLIGTTTWYWDNTKTNSALLANPGSDNIYRVVGWDGKLYELNVPNETTGYPKFKRDYWAFEFNAERPFDGQWYAKATYVLSHSYGTTEGQLRSDLWRTGGALGSYQGQAGVSTTQSWDHPALMENMNGDQSNDHRHQLKLFGLYQITEELGATASISAISGAPRPCLGAYKGTTYTGADPAGYGGSTINGGPYHFCYDPVTKTSKPANPGSTGRLGWVKSLDLGVSYKPLAFDKKLAVNVNVFNVFNSATATNVFPFSQLPDLSANPLWNQNVAFQTPRYVRMGVSYDY